MRPPKPRGGVQGGPDPPQPPHKLPTNQTGELPLLAEIRRRLKSNQTLPGTSSQVGDLLGPRDDLGLGKSLDGFQFRQPAETQKTADTLYSRHIPGIEGDPGCNKHYHQGSSSAPTQKMKDCRICMQSKPLYKFFSIKGCMHSYCSRCLRAYIKTKVNMKATLIKCPDPACKDSELEPLACKLIITKEVFDRWCDVLSESSVRVKFYCPFKDCSALLIDERGQEVMQESECPHCHRLFCAHCGVPWHSGLSCSEFLETENEEDKTLIKLAQKNQWQRCPKCKFYVERTSGCMFIQCRCGATFCYGCASQMEDDHYCQKCKR
ncbi:hypothetical protein IEQ34_017300 [Dendrobium chrysotoxum]|uniref:RBR-type E3 ubiquitin transferase n=1 Tax=Dendrobium chrysotoxum TaxID=161865 RepID=A0AAV7G9S3_DENCH|nr:hypothetical protein IEQ34_017300 [Dendrobium chrysotoxum]